MKTINDIDLEDLLLDEHFKDFDFVVKNFFDDQPNLARLFNYMQRLTENVSSKEVKVRCYFSTLFAVYHLTNLSKFETVTDDALDALMMILTNADNKELMIEIEQQYRTEQPLLYEQLPAVLNLAEEAEDINVETLLLTYIFQMYYVWTKYAQDNNSQ